MAGALGLLLGAGVGAAAGEIRQKRQQQQKHDDALFDFYSKNPTLVADSPDAQKFVTKYGGKDTAAAFIGMANHTKAAAEQFGKITGGEQQGGAASGGAPTAGPVPAAGGQSSLPMDPNAIEEEQRKLTAFQATDDGRIFERNNPGAIKAHIDLLEKHAARLQHDQEFQANQKRETQSHQDVEADKKQAEADRQEARKATQSLMAQNKAESNQFKQFQEQHMQEQDEEKRQKLADDQQKVIDSNRDKLLADFEKLPSGAKANAEARVTGYNAMASTFYRKHSDAGAPTLLKFNPGKKGSMGPLNIGGTDPTIEAVPPQYGTNKKTGATGWVDADGNFYAETSGGGDAGR